MEKTRLVLAGVVACLSFQTALADNATNVRAMTRNLYIGADTFRILLPGDPFDNAGDVLAIVLQTQFEERAKLLADEIERSNPHVIGLQEATTIFAQSLATGDIIFLDYLAILQGELAARGLNYVAPGAATSSNADVLIIANLPVAPGVRIPHVVNLLDRDVILVRGDIAFSNPDAGNYFHNAVIDLGGLGSVEFTRGWGSVDIHFAGHSYRFLNTHLEVSTSAGAATIQALQTLELIQGVLDPGTGMFFMPPILGVLAATYGPLPLVMAGDFNSAPDADCIHFLCGLGIGTPYQLLAFGAGFQDVWNLRKNKNGESENTCCFSEALGDDDLIALQERIDHIWVSGGIPVNGATVRTVGDELKRRTDDGLFPSDHLGVSARMSLEIAP
jgi:endonuclease/exonuclease/phosphatase family metal-dependent hydrolase